MPGCQISFGNRCRGLGPEENCRGILGLQISVEESREVPTHTYVDRVNRILPPVGSPGQRPVMDTVGLGRHHGTGD
jgi:hypothetical protein